MLLPNPWRSIASAWRTCPSVRWVRR